MEQRENDSNRLTPKVVVFNNMFVATSETFIYRQIQALNSRFHVELLAFKLVNETLFNLRDLKFLKIRKETTMIERAFRFFVSRVLQHQIPYYRSTQASLEQHLTQRKLLVHAHFGWNGLFVLPFVKKHAIPLVVSFHGNDASARLSNKAYSRRLPELFGYASHIIVCSSHMIETLGLKAYGKKVSVIPYGVDPDEFIPSPCFREPGVIRILHSGRLVPKKGVKDLIRVFADLRRKHSGILLQIAGDGEERVDCERLTQQLNISEFVTFFGAVNQEKVKELMNACDIFVLNSRTDERGSMEGLPNSVLEAMAFEKPVLSTRHAGIPMAIHDGVNGKLVAEKDNNALALGLEELIANEQLRTELGKKARVSVLEKFTTCMMTETMIDIFSNRLSEHQESRA